MEWVNIDYLIIAVCIMFSAFFSGSETALTAMSRAQMYALSQQGIRRAKLALALREKKDKLIGTILLGNNIFNIGAASVGTVVAIRLFGDEWGPVIATVALTIIILIFGEVLPKTFAIYHADRVSLLLSPMLALIMRLLSPLTWLVQQVVRGILRIFSIDLDQAANAISSAEAIRGTIELHHHEGEVGKDDRDMLASILDLGQRTVAEVMVHRSQVESIDIGLEPEQVIAQLIASNHSRIPLWKDNPENIVGVIHFKDLLRLVRAQKVGITREMIRRIAHKPWFVPNATHLDEQLNAFRHERKHFACVVDEYGAWLGIVTLEDIIEEIVGEIDDEHDPLQIAEIIPFGDRAYRIAGSVTIRDLNRQLDWDLPHDHASTVAGLVLHQARVIPDIGAMFEFSGYRFTIAERRANQITQIVVEQLEEAFPDVQE